MMLDKKKSLNKSSKRKKRAVSRDLLVSAAIKLADKKGLEGLSMRSLASKVGVEAMSLYNHVRNKEDLLDEIVDHVFGKIKWDKSAKDWRLSMEQRAISTKKILSKHKWVIKILESRKAPGPNTLAHHDAVIACLRSAGFSLELTATAFSSLDAYTYGYIMTEQTLPFENEEELKQIASHILENFPKRKYPNLYEFTEKHVLQPSYSYQNEFMKGLSLILDSIAIKLQLETS